MTLLSRPDTFVLALEKPVVSRPVNIAGIRPQDILANHQRSESGFVYPVRDSSDEGVNTYRIVRSVGGRLAIRDVTNGCRSMSGTRASDSPLRLTGKVVRLDMIE